MFKEPGADLVSPENSLERGENVKISLFITRHGERNSTGELADLGREITAEKAQEVLESGILGEDFDAIKPLGSPAGPKKSVEVQEGKTQKMARSVETAHIFGNKIAEETNQELFNTRNKPALSYETLKNKMPYNHTEIYNSFLPDNFNDLEGEERISAAKKAQVEVVNHLMNLDTPEARIFKEEVAGAFSDTVLHYEKMTKKLNSGSKVLMPIGAHSPMMETFLQKTLIHKDKEGNEVVGFNKVDEIGGEFNPSEGYLVEVETDNNGELKPLKFTFADKNRADGQEMYLDQDKIEKLANYYKDLHKEEK